ncbi:MAG: hypothetical protein IKR85_03630 [Clostridia bacterium]|nr:hypothetical protein [Clostridia bacterium]
MSHTYQVWALVLRYVLAALGLAVALRALYMTVRDGRSAARIRATHNSYGAVGVLSVLPAGKLGKAQKYSLARSGSVGGGSKCDVRIKGMGLKNPHFEYEITRRTLQITPASGGDVRMPGDKSARAGTFSVAQGQHILAGRAEMCFQLSKPRAAARSPLNKRVYREK